MRFVHFTILCLILISCSKKVNQYNKRKERKGSWITYADKEHTQILSKGKYRRGNPVGTWYYYTMNGELERKEKKRGKILLTINYNPETKRIFSKGKARIVTTPEKIHYFYYGKWSYFNSSGEPVKYAYFEKGICVKTEYVSKNNQYNDSLAKLLLNIDEQFRRKNDQLIDSVNHCWSNPKLAERYIQRIYMSDSMSTIRIEKIFNEYGYTDKELCGENASVVPFYIISYSPVEIREKYLEFFKAAAGLDKLDKKTLCYYIDKIKLTKGEKQIYGTQFYMVNRTMTYYPSIDPENLNKRRAEMGLEPVQR